MVYLVGLENYIYNIIVFTVVKNTAHIVITIKMFVSYH